MISRIPGEFGHIGHGEEVQLLGVDILPLDADELVPVEAELLVLEAQGVHCLKTKKK